MKRIYTIIVVLSGFLCSWAQESNQSSLIALNTSDQVSVKKSSFADFCKANDIFNHLDLGFTIGNGGLGFEFSSPVTRWTRLRLGYSWMPHMSVPMYFDLSNYGGSVDFETMQQAAKSYLGFEIEKNVRMNGKPLTHHLRVLLDIYPLQNKKQWRITTGFYWGPNKIANACNGLDEMQTTLGVMLYNKLYDYVMNTDFFETPVYGDIFLDPQVADMLKERFTEFGYLGVGIGKYKDDGRPCILEPDAKGKMTADMFVNNFCPYLGLGFDAQFGPEKRWKLGIDAGCLFWGGSPSIIIQALQVDSKGNFILDANGKRLKQDVDLVKEVTDITGKPGTYVDLTRKMKVYPMLNFKLSYALF